MRRKVLAHLSNVFNRAWTDPLYVSVASMHEQGVSKKAVTLETIKNKFKKGEPLTMVTGYDHSSAVHLENSKIDMLLVGDSAAMVIHGNDTTLPITLDEMIMHCKAVIRGASRPFIVCDLPFGSYESSTEQAVESAIRVLKETTVRAVKLEGGSPRRVDAVRGLTETGVAVMGHVGLTPQMVGTLGGFKAQAQMADKAMVTIMQGKELEKAGCFALLLECVPAAIGAALQKAVDIPVLGIGAGPACAGQVLVYHDLLGFIQHSQLAKVTARFTKRYVEVGELVAKGLDEFSKEVRSREYPGVKYSPYKIDEAEVKKLCMSLKDLGMDQAAEAALAEFNVHTTS